MYTDFKKKAKMLKQAAVFLRIWKLGGDCPARSFDSAWIWIMGRKCVLISVDSVLQARVVLYYLNYS